MAVVFTRKTYCKRSSRLCYKDLLGWIVPSIAGPAWIFEQTGTSEQPSTQSQGLRRSL